MQKRQLRLVPTSLLQSLFSVVATYLIVAAMAQAQTQFGTVVGTVTDPSHARVAEATVRATNAATGMGFSTVASSSGDYLISGLLPGTYTIAVVKRGFKDFSLTGVVVGPGATVRADAQLQIGLTTQTVTVTASAAELQTESAAVTRRHPEAVPQPQRCLPAVDCHTNRHLADVSSRADVLGRRPERIRLWLAQLRSTGQPRWGRNRLRIRRFSRAARHHGRHGSLQPQR